MKKNLLIFGLLFINMSVCAMETACCMAGEGIKIGIRCTTFKFLCKDEITKGRMDEIRYFHPEIERLDACHVGYCAATTLICSSASNPFLSICAAGICSIATAVVVNKRRARVEALESAFNELGRIANQRHERERLVFDLNRYPSHSRPSYTPSTCCCASIISMDQRRS